MATNSLSGFDGLDDEFPPELTRLDDALPPVSAVQQAEAGEDDFDPAAVEFVVTEEDAPKELLDVRGFLVSAGSGIYDGARREGEEPRDSFFVDVQDYETGAVHRVWGVVLGEVMSLATAQYDLKPGSRVHLIQQGKREIFTDSVVNGTMVNRRTHANAWVCMPDRGPLPSQLAHLMAGINVDQALDRIALRHDMGLDDPRLPGWKQEQKRILSAFGEDPQTIKGWLNRQLSLSAAEERKLVAAAVELQGYTEADPDRRQHEIDVRMDAIREMSADERYDFLMEGAKPHLMAGNRAKEEGLRAEVVQAIEQVAVMATADEHPDSARRKAMRSALVQSLEGLSLTQQFDHLALRREQILQGHFACASASSENASPRSRVSREGVIDVQGLTSEEYQLLLEERLAMAESKEERAEMLAAEIAARKLESGAAQSDFEAIDHLYQRFSRERDLDALAFVAGEVVMALGKLVCHQVLPRVSTTFEALGGLGSWRKRGCVNGLDQLRDSLAQAKQAPVYKAFETDPAVVAACAGNAPAQMVAKYPEFSRTDVVMEHLDAQAGASAPRGAADSRGKEKPVKKGLWAGVTGAMTELSDRVSHMSPENLLKGGKLDSEWVKTMQSGLQDFGQELKETLMPEKLRAQMQEMLASIMSMIRAMMEMAKDLVASKAPKAAVAEATAGMEP